MNRQAAGMRSHIRHWMLCAMLAIAAAQMNARPAWGDDKWTMPVTPACISSPFGWRHYVGPMAPAGMHNGIDLPAPAGAHVYAVAAGRVRMVKKMGMAGLQIEILHPSGLVTMYAHLGSMSPAIATGQRIVTAGSWLGRIGRTGVTYGTHLFFMVLSDGKPVDPAPYLGVTSCR
jgi:murein DD-endopeptidase MepM/ murein hydrolase activator NlpD